MKLTLHKYQQRAAEFLASRSEAALFLDPGLGKTATTLKAWQASRKAGKSGALFVLAPVRVCYNVWSKSGELGKWDDFAGLKVALLHGKKKEEAFESDADIYVMNYEGLPWLCDRIDPTSTRTRLQDLMERGMRSLVIDELSKFKHPKTKRFKLLEPYLKGFRQRWGLTGSPAANNLIDLFGECKVLDLGKRLGRFITYFRRLYCYQTGYMGKEWVPQPGAEPRIYAAIKDLALTMRATDHLDLPELMQENVWVDLSPAARKFYDTFEADMIAEFGKVEFVAGSAGVVSGKCRQIASGGLYYDVLTGKPSQSSKQQGELSDRMQRFTKHIHDAKTEALSDLVDELQGAPLLVGIGFRHDRDRIRLALGDKTPSLDGDTAQADAENIIRRWNMGEINVLLFHPQAAGHGINLQGCGCAHVCWYTPPWDRELYDQSIARVWRQGTKAKRVVVHRILARETVDEAVVKALGAKGRAQNNLFEALKVYAEGKKKR